MDSGTDSWSENYSVLSIITWFMILAFKKEVRMSIRKYLGAICKLKEPEPALKPGRVIRVTFSPGHPGLTRFTIYPGLTRKGSREKRNCSFDDVELINAIA